MRGWSHCSQELNQPLSCAVTAPAVRPPRWGASDHQRQQRRHVLRRSAGRLLLMLADGVQLRRTDYDFEATAAQFRRTDFPHVEALAVRYVLSPPTEDESLQMLAGAELRAETLRCATYRECPASARPTAVASAAPLASDECRTALSIEHFSSRHSLGEQCLWRTMQSQQGDGISGGRGPVLEPMIEDQAVWTD